MDSEIKELDLFFHALAGSYELHKLDALDMFARAGAHTVSRYWSKVASLALWELNEEHRMTLQELYLPTEVKIGCSYAEMRQTTKKFGLIVVDSPQGLHTDSDGLIRCEHFEVLTSLPVIMQDRCIVTLYVNKEPYNAAEVGSRGQDTYDVFDWESWMDHRARFYCTSTPAKISLATAMLEYQRLFAGMGIKIASEIVQPCFVDGVGRPAACYVALELVKL